MAYLLLYLFIRDQNQNLLSTFSFGNGEKQGVLSPVLFTVYLDSLIDELGKKFRLPF